MNRVMYRPARRSNERRLLILLPLVLLAFVLLVCGVCAAAASALLFTSHNAPAQASSDQARSSYIALARQDAAVAGISPQLFVMQIAVESNFDPQSRSPAGAEGIAQLMPATAASLGVDPWNPAAALQAAAQLMARYVAMYSGDYAKALAAYNAGTGAVRSALHECGSARWQHCLPAETQRYIQLITQ